jgi:hypothetical protein
LDLKLFAGSVVADPALTDRQNGSLRGALATKQSRGRRSAQALAVVVAIAERHRKLGLKQIALVLGKCSFSPGTWDKRFCRAMSTMATHNADQPLSERQRDNLLRMATSTGGNSLDRVDVFPAGPVQIASREFLAVDI